MTKRFFFVLVATNDDAATRSNDDAAARSNDDAAAAATTNDDAATAATTVCAVAVRAVGQLREKILTRNIVFYEKFTF